MEAWGLHGFLLKPNLLDYIRRPLYEVETSWSDYFLKTRESFELKLVHYGVEGNKYKDKTRCILQARVTQHPKKTFTFF